MKRTLTTLLILLPLYALAWGPSGHYISGEIAQQLLDKKASKKINGILGNAEIAMVSNWADNQKQNPAFKSKSDWHYNNFESGLTFEEFCVAASDTAQGKLTYKIGEMIDNLTANPNDTTSLLMLIHMVEDLHCPMHMGHASDRGGNSIEVKWFGRKTNLHSLWDDKITDSQKLSYTEYSRHILRTHKPEKNTFDKQILLRWAWNTYNIAEQIYDDVDAVGNNYKYIYTYRDTLEKQLFLAGQNLALILHHIYK